MTLDTIDPIIRHTRNVESNETIFCRKKIIEFLYYFINLDLTHIVSLQIHKQTYIYFVNLF